MIGRPDHGPKHVMSWGDTTRRRSLIPGSGPDSSSYAPWVSSHANSELDRYSRASLRYVQAFQPPEETDVPTTPVPGDRSPRRVLQVGPLKPSLSDTLRSTYDALELPADQPAQAEFLGRFGADVGAVVTSGRTGVDAELMAALPNLGAVVNFGVGYD